MNYDVTIGIPVYQAEAYLTQSLLSALNQSYASIEFLVVDDGCTDRSMDVVRKFQREHSRGDDIHILSHKTNRGVAVSRNRIIEKAQGIFLYFMDADDTIDENCISLLMSQVRKYDAEVVFGSYEKIELSGHKSLYLYPSLLVLEKDQLADYAYRRYGGIQASACNFVVKLALLCEKRLRFIETNYWEDMAFVLDLITEVSRAVLLPNVTYCYRCREGSLSHYQKREMIEKREIIQNMETIDYLKRSSLRLCDKEYYPRRCYYVVMTDLYMACHIIRYRRHISPSVSNREVRDMLSHPASFRQICSFRQMRMRNLLLYMLGKLPPSLCVATVWCINQCKRRS